MSQKRQKPNKRKAYARRPQQKIHKINGQHTHQTLLKHLTTLKAQGKLTEAIQNGEIENDTIPDLIQESITGIYRMTTTLLCLKALTKEGTIKLVPNLTSITDVWNREIIRFEENANAYIVLKEQHVKNIDMNSDLSEEEKVEERKDESSLADIVFDLIDGINDLFIKHALDIADLTERYNTDINEYIKDHVLENETPNDFAVRICQTHINSIREQYATKLTGDAQKVSEEVITELVEG